MAETHDDVAGARAVRDEDAFDAGVVDTWLRGNADASGIGSHVLHRCARAIMRAAR